LRRSPVCFHSTLLGNQQIRRASRGEGCYSNLNLL
jgi:hypothetical protein